MFLPRVRGALGLTLTLAAAAFAGPAPTPAKADSASSASSTSPATSLPSMGDFSFTSKKEPIQITSEKLDFDYKNRRTVFHGDVDVIQGEVHLQSDVLTVDYAQVGDKQELKEVTAEGHVAITQGPKKATGNHAVFNQSNRTLTLTGNAVLEEGSNQVNGDRIVVHPDESRMEVLGENRRVKVILFPGQGALADGTSGKDKPSPKPGGRPAPTQKP